MRIRSLALAALLALLALFVALNWDVLSPPAVLSLGFTHVQAPPGLVLLGFAAALCGVLLIHILLLQAGVIMEGRRLAREIATQREIADKAEASRIAELKNLIDTSVVQREADSAALRAALIDQVNESTASLSAHLGEIEDKLDRVLGSKPL